MNGDFGNDVGADQAFERELLASAAADGVSDENVRAAWSHFALTLGATATFAGATTHGSLASGVAAGGRGVLRWLSLGALGGGIVTAALMTVLSGRGVPAAGGGPTSAATATATASPLARPTATHGDVAVPAVDAARTPKTGAAPAPNAHESAPQRPSALAARPARAQGPTAPDVASSLAAEIALLDDARRAQSAGQFELALTILGRYQREHPHGVLRRESDVLKLETLAKSGEHDEAERLARRFLEAFPDDPHAAHVRTFVQ